MASYTFRCPSDGRVFAFVSPSTDGPPEGLSCECGKRLKRDYRSDAPLLAIAHLKNERDPDYHDRLFLPDAEDFKGPKDPDGQKGIKEWNENHVPRESNKKPKRPKTDKVVF